MEGCPDRFDRMTRHDHIVCRRCGKLSDIALEDLTQKLQSQMDFPMISYDLKINYICADCLKKRNEGTGE